MQDANNKITDLTKKCKSLTEELMGLKKQSEEVHESKKVSKLLLFKITKLLVANPQFGFDYGKIGSGNYLKFVVWVYTKVPWFVIIYNNSKIFNFQCFFKG